jgi:hypothetical protein
MLAVLALPFAVAGLAKTRSPRPPSERAPLLLEDPFAASWIEADRAIESAEARAAVAPEDARGDFRLAAEAYGRAAAASPSPVVLANLGTAQLRAGDFGRAIAALRAALLLAPESSPAEANLAEARRAIAADAPAPVERAIDGVRAWWAPFGTEVGMFGWIAWCVGLALVGLGAIHPDGIFRRARAAGVTLATLGCVSLATIVVDRIAIESDRTCVVTASVLPRSGNGLGFAPVRTAPLPVGTECRVLEERPGWTELEWSDGTRGWVETDRLARVSALLRVR